MNFPLAIAGSKLTPHLRGVLTQLLTSRCTSKIAVEMEAGVLAQLTANEVKAREQPGIVKGNHLELPAQIDRALQRVIGDHPVKTLLRDCQRLNQYISSRHPPSEQEEVYARIREITAEVDERTSPEKLSAMDEDAAARWQKQREQAVRRRLAQRTYAWKPISYGPYEALVYAIGRGAQEYAVLLRILRELEGRDSAFKPRSYFDFGSGVGTGMWAASNFWKDSIFEYYNVDSSREMHELSELILREGNENQQLTLRNVYYRQFLPASEVKYDLVLSAYSLFELPSEQQRQEILLNLWRKCDGYLIIVEEGTRRGSELVNEARSYLLRLKDEELRGHVFAPCPHDSTCPRLASAEDNTPCNFEVSYPPLRMADARTDLHRARYSYVVLKKGDVTDPTTQWPRLVRPTLSRTKHVVCRMCTADARLQEVIFTPSKHGKTAYRCAKASRWGDRLPLTVGKPFNSKIEISNDSLEIKSEIFSNLVETSKKD